MASCTAMVLALAVSAGCDRSAPTQQPSGLRASASNGGQPWFVEEAAKRGIDFVWSSGQQDRFFMPEIVGGGAAVFDFDNDGDLDIYLVQGGSIVNPASNPPNVLLRNRGDGHFDAVANAGGAGDRGYGMGAACGDFDNDGHVDLYVTNVGPNALYRNNGDGSFTNVTATAGVGHEGWGTSAAWVDIDNDGWLDLYVVNYLTWSIATEQDCFNTMGPPDYCGPLSYNAPAMDVLYRNNGDGTFSNITLQAGLDAFFGNGLGVVAGDFNTDGWSDLFIANDGHRDQLWMNQRDGTFIDMGLQLGVALDEEGKAKAGMGTHAADLNDNGKLDVVVCNLRRESDSVFLNEGSHFFDATTSAGLRTISRGFTRFGLGLLDFDNDGWLDLYEACGMVMSEDTKYTDDPYAEPNLLFKGKLVQGAPRFEEIKPRGGTNPQLIHTSRAAAFGDLDNDGGVDVLVINRDGPTYLLRNVAPDRGKWVMLRVLDEHGRDAYGATVSLKLGERTINRDVRAAYSYMASNDPRVHIGLGKADQIRDVTVRWIDGTIESFGDLAADQIHTLKRGDGGEGGRGPLKRAVP